jgi:pimeloyl-ACP methyl ester carboxylesterase
MFETPVVEPPDVQYAASGDLSIAYQVVGGGPVDLVYVTFLLSPIFSWYVPQIVEFFQGLASFTRLILFDKRGLGASDRPRTLPTLEAQMDDMRAVLDAVGSERAALLGIGHGGQMAALFAATYPERTHSLVLYNAFARLPGYSVEHQQMVTAHREQWGRRDMIEQTWRGQAPSLADDPSFQHGIRLAMLASAHRA